MFFRQYWIDPRLAFGPSLGIQKIKLSGNIVDQVWLPDIYFVNDLSDKSACGDFLFEVTQEGLITYSCRSFYIVYCFASECRFSLFLYFLHCKSSLYFPRSCGLKEYMSGLKLVNVRYILSFAY